jgi:hypothetical protein
MKRSGSAYRFVGQNGSSRSFRQHHKNIGNVLIPEIHGFNLLGLKRRAYKKQYRAEASAGAGGEPGVKPGKAAFVRFGHKAFLLKLKYSDERTGVPFIVYILIGDSLAVLL